MASSSDMDRAEAAVLRSRAEEKLTQETPETRGLSPEELKTLVHELHVHQIELEMQNEQLRQTQADLEHARERYFELYEGAPVGYLSINPELRIVAANLTAVAMLGVERSRLVTLPFGRFVIKEDQDTFYLSFRKALSSPLTQPCEVRLHSEAGQVFHAHLELLQATEDGKTVCHVTVSDITEQKQAEELLREKERRELQYENEERLRLAFEAGDLGAWDQNFRTGQIACSERTCLMLGFPPRGRIRWEEVVERVHPDDRPHFLAATEQGTRPRSGGKSEVVFRVVLPGESDVRWLRFTAQCNFEPAPSSRLIRRTGVLADITVQKEAEELLESRAQQLEVMVRERTTRLQEAVGELEHFSYTLAHDLRAPLRTIRGYTELLMEQAELLTPDHRQYLQRTNSAAGRLDLLIRDALNYNKLVRQHFGLSRVDSQSLLAEVLDSYPQFVEARDRIHVEDKLPPVLGNPALLTQCFSNLLNNAIKFVAPGREPRIRIFSQDLGERVRIVFEDNGLGIPADCHARIFDIFQRLSTDFEGTGIGLALVRKAAQRMQGEVGLESQPGDGSRFWLELKKPES